jgi:predicted N-acetyltransferase YhbS
MIPRDRGAALAVVRRERLSAAENAALFGWSADIFGSTFGLSWRAPAFHFVGARNGAPVAHVGALRHSVEVDGRDILVGGVAAVVTLPAARGNGFAETLLRAAANAFAAEGLGFCFLFCSDRMLAYYERLGWRRVDAPVLIRQGEMEQACPVNAMTLALSKEPWPAGRVRANSEPW